MIHILLLDDHAVVRAGYRKLIAQEPDMQVVAEAATSAQACELVRQQQVDVAVVDLSLKGDSGLEAIPRLRQRCPGLRVLVFTMHAHHGFALQALRAGASGYLTKDSDPDDMLEAIRLVHQGRRIYSGEIAQALLAEHGQHEAHSPLTQLTPREFEVLRLAAHGQSTDQIAGALCLSPKTIHNNMSLIRQKLDAHSDFQLLRLAAEHGLVQL
ncbi:LuxR family two component transcriptional regulator [Sphaerotilus hippei]|uniref:LuxR family two component transcriptional regulator n=1 Tax=Sphaerotilus hippei TaxID=744406 RepID=A0A318HG42_9BURK|nr:response regulator transcription factor [Sphaerotilus hippei]PXW98809.1 LuxR family two component transcriptional regulator [Sphaerotilus hippei]